MSTARKILGACLAVVLGMMTLAACTGNKSDESAGIENGGNGGKPDKVVFAYLSFNNIPEDLSDIEEVLNNYLRDKINVEVELKLYGPFEYEQRVNLALQSGEQLDLFTTYGGFSGYVARNQLYPLDDLLETYGHDLLAILEKDFGPDLLKATTMNGKIYGIPVNKGFALPTTFVYDADLLAELGFSADDINSLEDLPIIFEALKQKYPEIVPFGPINVNPNDTYLLGWMADVYEIDTLTDFSYVGVVFGDSGKVVNLYETEEFRKAVDMMYEWNQKGYLQKDAAVTTIPMSELIASGKGFSFMGGYAGMQAGKALSAQMNKNIETKRITKEYFETSSINAVVWMMNRATKVPEAAMKFLNVFYTDPFVINTLLYGIEGRDYVKVDEHTVRFPDGMTANDVPYTAQLSTGLIGSESLQYQFEGTDWSDVELKLRENKETKRSPYFGFIFDMSDVRTEMSAINNVKNQYVPGLITGSLDPETTIPKFIQALKDAGADRVIQAKQEQLDRWLEQQGMR